MDNKVISMDTKDIPVAAIEIIVEIKTFSCLFSLTTYAVKAVFYCIKNKFYS